MERVLLEWRSPLVTFCGTGDFFFFFFLLWFSSWGVFGPREGLWLLVMSAR